MKTNPLDPPVVPLMTAARDAPRNEAPAPALPEWRVAAAPVAMYVTSAPAARTATMRSPSGDHAIWR